MDTFTFNGCLSSSYNVFVIGTSDSELPVYDYNVESIEGVTRDIHISNKRLKNKDVVYHCLCTQNAAENVSRFLGLLMMDNIYGKLEDTIHPEYYKMGTYAGGTKQRFYGSNDVSTFDVIFNCDPRKFLINNGEYTRNGRYTGDTFVDMPVGSWFYLYNENAGIYFNPVFYLSHIESVQLREERGYAQYYTSTIVDISGDTTLYYDTDSKLAYSENGTSMESAIYSRSWKYPVIQTKGVNLSLRANAYSGATEPVAKVAIREYLL